VAPPFGKCVWDCDSARPFNREHIIGKQVAKAFGMPFPVPMKWGEVERHTGAMIERGERMEDGLEIVLEERVCERCNGQWMRKLDEKMLKFMWSTLRHEKRVQLNAGNQATLAQWAVKVGPLLALWFHDETLQYPELGHRGASDVPTDNFLAVGRRMKPADRTRIWVAAIDATVPISEFFAVASPIYSPDDQPERIPRGYYSLFHLRRMLFFVSGWEVAYPGNVGDWPNPEPIVRDPRAMSRISPLSERVVEWPPPARLESNDLDKLIAGQPDRIQPATS
jgi:hypothetical protein